VVLFLYIDYEIFEIFEDHSSDSANKILVYRVKDYENKLGSFLMVDTLSLNRLSVLWKWMRSN
jgi:hypothetical protein